jgi:hypothetical protein
MNMPTWMHALTCGLKHVNEDTDVMTLRLERLQMGLEDAVSQRASGASSTEPRRREESREELLTLSHP